MNTKILEYIIAIAQEGSISRAANRFYLTQPVLSRHLKKIEDRLGTPLFIRQKDGMALTEAGRIYINSAQNILHLESELENDLHTMLEEEKNTLWLYMDYPYVKQLSDQLLHDFREKYPDVHVRFIYESSEELLASLSSGETGIGILTTSGKRYSWLEYVTLRSYALVVITPENAENRHTIFMPPTGTALRAMEERWLAQKGAVFHTILEARTFRDGLEGVRSGQGCACVPESMAAHAGLKPRSDLSSLPVHVCAVYPKNMVFRPASRALLQSTLRAAEEWNEKKPVS